MKIYLARNNVQAGPYTLDQLNTMLVSGEVSLDDLLWHSPMTTWQRVGDVTANQYRYQPTTDSMSPPVQPVITPSDSSIKGGFGDNPDFNADSAAKSNEPRRVSVADLYGQKPANPTQNQQQSSPWVNQHTKPNQTQSPVATVYASIGSRFLAVMINCVLFALALLPFFQAFMGLNPDPVLMNTGEFAARMAYAQELAAKIPTQAAGLTTALVIGYIIIQLLLIIARGQSFGKLVVGIRTVDAVTLALPSFIKRVFLRVLVPVLIYLMASSAPLFINLAVLLLGINYFLAARSPNKQGWHDKLAGTVVIKSPSATTKTK